MKEFIEVCRKLNEHRVKYVVCGAYASKLYGVEKISGQERKTKDYDFIVERSKENIKKIKEALKDINPKIEKLRDNDLVKYRTVEIVGESNQYCDIDLISNLWEVDYKKACEDEVVKEIEGVKIPVLNIDRLLEMKKDSFRPQDRADTYWLEQIKKKQDE